MVPQYEKTQYNQLVFSRPLFILSQQNEGEKREEFEAARKFVLAWKFLRTLPNPPSINILVVLLSVVWYSVYLLINCKRPSNPTMTPLGAHLSAATNTFINDTWVVLVPWHASQAKQQWVAWLHDIAVVCNCKRYSVWNFCTFSECTCSCGIFIDKSSFSST